jgi:NAD(P)-dependent dehydrogenase (short-subunit alcohol dehydrogenase family)
MKKILIFGGLGVLGLEITKHLKKNFFIVVVDVSSNLFFKKLNLDKNIIYFKYSNFSQIKQIYNKHKFYAVIHCQQYKNKKFTSSDIRNLDLNLFKKINNINLEIPLVSSHYYISHINRDKKNIGRIINITSTYGVISSSPELYTNTNMGNPVYYTLSKFGLVGLTKYVASYYKHLKILCNCISPHGIENKHQKKFINNFSKRSPIGRLSKAKEVLPAIDFLLDKNNTYTNGSNISVDGGWTAC